MKMRYLLILLSILLPACGQPSSSGTEASQVDLALIEPPIEDVEDLSGKKIVYLNSHPFGSEVFEASGKWSTDISMRGPLYLHGTWRQNGLEICVEIDEGSWDHDVVGTAICREIKPRPQGLFLVPITPTGDASALQFNVFPIN